MRLLARGVQFWQDHGARATYRATLRKLRLSVTGVNTRSPATSPLLYGYACGRIPFRACKRSCVDREVPRDGCEVSCGGSRVNCLEGGLMPSTPRLCFEQRVEDAVGGLAVPERRAALARVVEGVEGGGGDRRGVRRADEPVRAVRDGDRAFRVFA